MISSLRPIPSPLPRYNNVLFGNVSNAHEHSSVWLQLTFMVGHFDLCCLPFRPPPFSPSNLMKRVVIKCSHCLNFSTSFCCQASCPQRAQTRIWVRCLLRMEDMIRPMISTVKSPIYRREGFTFIYLADGFWTSANLNRLVFLERRGG